MINQRIAEAMQAETDDLVAQLHRRCRALAGTVVHRDMRIAELEQALEDTGGGKANKRAKTEG